MTVVLACHCSLEQVPCATLRCVGIAGREHRLGRQILFTTLAFYQSDPLSFLAYLLQTTRRTHWRPFQAWLLLRLNRVVELFCHAYALGFLGLEAVTVTVLSWPRAVIITWFQRQCSLPL